MKNVKFKLFSAGFVLAMALTFSCSSGDDDLPCLSCDEDSGGYGGKGNNIGNYRTVKIGTQTWMAENLNYAVAGSKCYGEGGEVYGYDEEKDDYIWKTLTDKEVQANCDKYGRLYDWVTAMALPPSCNESSCSSQIQPKHKGICPSGWHIPSNDDWDKLLRYVDNENGGDGDYERDDGFYESYTAGKYLKSADGWNWNDYDGISGNGTDKYGFSALPGGGGYSCGVFGFVCDYGFDNVGDEGYWWSATDYNAYYAYYRNMYYEYGDAVYMGYNYESVLLSVRCLQD